MTRQIGSILLILLIVTSLTSITTLLVLKSGLSFKKQINLSMLHQKSNDLTKTESFDAVENITTGIDLNSLPISKITNLQYKNHYFTISQTTTSISIVNSPLSGYSLNSAYKTQLAELKTGTSSLMVKSTNIINGFGCLWVENTGLSNQIESTYSLDIDQDSVNDVSYQFDSVSGDISRVNPSAKLLVNLALGAEQSFSRPQFSYITFNKNSKLALALVVQNTGTVTQTASNIFYLLFDKPLFDSLPKPPINPDDFADLNTNPVFSDKENGYYLQLDQGQLISSAITIFNHKIIFITQSPSVDPNTGDTQYTNKLITINLDKNSKIIPSMQVISSSGILLELGLATQNHLIIILSSQFEPLINMPGECRPVYQYEN